MKREPDDSAAIAAIFASWSTEEDQRGKQQERLKQLFANAKDAGYNTKALRAAFKEHYRLQHQSNEEAAKRSKSDEDVELYLTALARVRGDQFALTTQGEVSAPTGPVAGTYAGGSHETLTPRLKADPAPPAADAVVIVENLVERADASYMALGSDVEPVAPIPSQLEETQRQGESEQRRDNGSQPVFVQEGSVEAEGQGGATREQGAGEPSQPALPNHRVENKPDGPAVMVAAPTPEPEVHTSWLKSTIVPIRKPVTEAPKQDRTKPHPDCLDPAECGLSSWDWFCSSCKKAAEAKRAGAA